MSFFSWEFLAFTAGALLLYFDYFVHFGYQN